MSNTDTNTVTSKLAVVLMGAIGAGKSTITNATAQLLDADVLSFATYLKSTALEAGWSGVKDAEGRRFLQEHADRMKLVHGEDVFFRHGIEAARQSSKDTVIFDDGRAFVELGGATLLADPSITLLVIDFYETNAEDRWYNAAIRSEPWACHRSETEWRSIRDRYVRYTNIKDFGIPWNAYSFAAFIAQHGSTLLKPGMHRFACPVGAPAQ